MANRIPRIKRFDSTRVLLRDPYGFIGQHCRRERTDVFEARILLRRVLCMSGPEAAALIYDRERFKRHGATPEPVRATLFGKGGVQGLDDEAHRRRKGMFMSIMTPGRVRELAELAVQQWEAAARQWAIDDRVVLYDELHVLLTRTVCAWAGLPLCEPELRQRARDLASLFDSAGALPWGHLRARRARSRAERWISERVRSIRRAPRGPGVESPAGMIASHKDEHGRLLPARIAAVEILNLVRPTVAVSVYIVFLVHALHEHPEWRERITGDPAACEWFVQEVRRFYPFSPAIFARVRRRFEWHGYEFKRGRRVLLDITSTNHDPRAWEAPDEFRPDRFAHWAGDPVHPHSAGRRRPLSGSSLRGRVAHDRADESVAALPGRAPALRSGAAEPAHRPDPPAGASA